MSMCSHVERVVKDENVEIVSGVRQAVSEAPRELERG